MFSILLIILIIQNKKFNFNFKIINIIKMTTVETEVDYIPEHEDFQIMKKVYLPEVIGLSKGVWNQAFEFLKDVLILTYGMCQFGLLVSAVEKNPFEEAKKISQNFSRIAELNEWSEKTTISSISNMKKIMKQTTINVNFINKLTTVKEKGIDRKSVEYCLPGKYKKYNDDHPEKKLLMLWLETCKKDTRNKSQSSMKQIIQFVLKICDGLNLSLHNYDEDMVKNIPLTSFQKVVDQIGLKMPRKTKVRFAIIIIKNFFRCNIPYSDLEEWTKSIPKEDGFINDVDDHDLHRISNGELDAMFEATKSNIRDRALFLLMATTGLRVGGVSNLLLKNVATEVGGKVVILNEGRTVEKGRKWFTFPLCDKLKRALEKWIVEDRNVLSDYLFPGSKQSSLSPSRISKIVKEIAARAGLDGKHIHAHSIRHSFAHILLEAGNDPGLVGKMMGHSSSKTTEKFYLKDTAVEASKRCNIPWLSKNVEVEPLPSFMIAPSTKKEITRKIRQLDKRKALKLISKEFEMKKILPTLPEI
jgi:site-specific recombinase XerD